MKSLLLATLLTTLLGCTTQPPADDRLYQELGGQPGITRIVEGMLLNIARDERIRHYFANVDIGRLRRLLIQQFCAETGGPCRYQGASMAESHRGLNLQPADFNALVEDLQLAMQQEGVPERAQNGLLARLAPQRGAVIRQ
ncbi:group I truncated hemoglobin [Pseudomonas rhizoryzae]|uniref:group I truncated hemoglobin n=1 Tax=Pseudomonas rhizoryzae TaxID=2571129 RepID=UPI0007363A44|nr:group 1 truncated hemoglobin [Pseudomonas rhizoryzae]KTS92163.1 globin [Pseudomonas psychrotolerans]KTT10374.1 globin [Pseudomonas psychrotolerans]KTT29226.1 globin [Pseudomonas psychrotolerans]KTT30973.1 globin [Pseudomonas psychrotolerans]KTT53892.1 globin [Pseudomonas psychrotolerans]